MISVLHVSQWESLRNTGLDGTSCVSSMKMINFFHIWNENVCDMKQVGYLGNLNQSHKVLDIYTFIQKLHYLGCRICESLF